MADGTLFDLDEIMAWARGEIRLKVRLPDGASDEMSVAEYCREYEIQERLRAYRLRPVPDRENGRMDDSA
jgi:hypothetical protein